METATFAAGCFWGVEAAFRKVKGVISTEVGYTGGTSAHPTYKDVCTGSTGHAEAVRIVFDPAVVTYEQLLSVFWKIHNPTSMNRQGPDVGTQYRSAIFCHGDVQCAAAKASKQRMNASGTFSDNIVTEVEHAGPFFRAEEYHQQYFEKHRDRGCSFW